MSEPMKKTTGAFVDDVKAAAARAVKAYASLQSKDALRHEVDMFVSALQTIDRLLVVAGHEESEVRWIAQLALDLHYSMPFESRFGSLLRRAREQKGISQANLAALVGSDQSNISTYETGNRMPSAVLLIKIARALDIKIEEFK